MRIQNVGAASLAVLVIMGLNLQPANADWRDYFRGQRNNARRAFNPGHQYQVTAGVQADMNSRITATQNMIATGQNSGQLNPAAAQQLQSGLQQIINVSAQYAQGGYTAQEQAELVQSLNSLNAQITQASVRY